MYKLIFDFAFINFTTNKFRLIIYSSPRSLLSESVCVCVKSLAFNFFLFKNNI